MLKQAFLHIGSNKTGTTTIQHCLARFRDTADAGFYYPRAGTFSPKTKASLPNRQAGLRLALDEDRESSDSLMRRFGVVDPHDRRDYRAYFVDEFDKEIGGFTAEWPVIMSDENFFILSSEPVATGAATFLSDRFRQIDVIVYLRRPDEYIGAKYSQYIKGGGTEKFSAFLKRNLSSAKYFKKLKPWITAFGLDHVRVRYFDRTWLRDGDILCDFFAAADLAAPSLPKIKKNPSLSPFGVEVLRRVNKHFARLEVAVPGSFTRQANKYFAGKSDFFSRQQRSLLINFIKDDDESLRNCLGAERLHGFYAIDDLRAPITPALPAVDEDAAKRVARQMIDAYRASTLDAAGPDADEAPPGA